MTGIVPGLGPLADRYDAFLVDQFGVVIGGAGAYPWAPAALARLARTGKPVLLLSNSGKRAAANEARLARLGFERGSYLMVLSSGEAAHAELARRLADGRLPQGAPVWLHAREGAGEEIAGLGLSRAFRPEAAALVIFAGSRGDALSRGEYAEMLRPAAEAGVPALCTNPDMEMLTPKGPRFGAGAIAALYEEMGGAVERIGKPHPLIYAEAARRLAGIDPARTLAIGDSPAHDILGARRAGHASALVLTGLQAGLSAEAALARAKAEGAAPDYLLSRFAFED
jgi:HAD superfamily hydrolase (TIGR01459 family)